MQRGLAAGLVLLSVAALCNCSRPRYIGCQSSQECGKEECCVIGMGRYSIPTCQPRRDLGDSCRPHSDPTNTTLSYPDGVTVELTDVHYLFCPCTAGLYCVQDGGDMPTCVDSLQTNRIYEYSEEY